MPTPTITPEGKDIFIEGIPWAIAVVGWACTHLFSEARERRKEVRSQLDKAYEQLQKLEQDGRAFHCAAEFDVTKSIDLTSRLSTLERVFRRIDILKEDDLNRLMIALRRGITLRNFDKSKFQSQDISSEVLSDISIAAEDLEFVIEAQYSRRYPNKFPYFTWRDTR